MISRVGVACALAFLGKKRGRYKVQRGRLRAAVGPWVVARDAHMAACGAGAHVSAVVAVGGRAALQWVARRTWQHMEYSGIAGGDSNGGCDVLIIIQMHTMQFDMIFYKKIRLKRLSVP